MYEETGDLEVDLEEACKYYKPKYIREFMLNNPVEKPKSLKVSKNVFISLIIFVILFK